MIVAISAKARCVLGATLILVTAPNISNAGIEGGNVTGIEGANILGIEGANILGIEGGNVTGIEGANALGIEGGNIFHLLTGPLSNIDVDRNFVISLGQTIMVSADMLSQLSVGDLVTVEGTIAGPGLLYADAVTVSARQYVAGSTEVFVTGILSSVDASTGTAMLGELQVDYTSSLASGNSRNGVVWAFRGTQPNQKGVMLSDRVQAY